MEGGLLLSGLAGLTGSVWQRADEGDAIGVGDDLEVTGDEIVD